MNAPPDDLASLFPSDAIELLTASGAALARKLGLEVIRGVVLDVLSGRNLRDSTEKLTRKRISQLNAGMVEFFVRQEAATPGFVRDLPSTAERILRKGKASKPNRWLALWVLGLTEKAFQNVLKDDHKSLAAYRDAYTEICAETVSGRQATSKALSGNLSLPGSAIVPVDDLFLIYLLNTVGAQTLAIRGSEKSAYGKLFEKLILGTALSILGFEFVDDPSQKQEMVFWFTTASEKRESDATLLFEPGLGVRFDIGFIGRGNSEISLDKVSRFARVAEVGNRPTHVHTVIVVDRIGSNSRLKELANQINGEVVQMSMSLWVKDLATHLQSVHKSYTHPLIKMKKEQKVLDYLGAQIAAVPIESFLPAQGEPDTDTDTDADD